MRIPYLCSHVGYGAMFVEYGEAGATLRATPDALDFGAVSVGLSLTLKVRVTNISGVQVSGQAMGLNAPFAVEGQANYVLVAGASKDITVRFTPSAPGDFYGELILSASQGQALEVPVSGQGLGTAPPADLCNEAPLVGAGVHNGSNAGAGTDGAASCAAASGADVWWRCVFADDGIGIFDTAGSSIDTVLSVYDTCGGQELACSDDVSATETYSRVTIDVSRVQTYVVRVAGKNGQTGNVRLSITGLRNAFGVAGRITRSGGGGLAGVTLTGLPGQPVTDDNGVYAATVPRGFSGTVRPVKAGWEFDPPERRYENVSDDVVGADYQAAPASYTIAGRVVSNRGGALSGVSLRGLPGKVVTDGEGRYSAEVSYGFTAEVVPELANHVFDPPRRSYQNVSADFIGQDYTGRHLTGELQIVLEPADLSGTGWRVDSGDWQNGGAVLRDLTVGGHRLSFRPVEGWTAPPLETFTIQADKCLKLTRHYQQITYLLALEARPARSGTIEATPPGDGNGRHVVGTLVRLRAKPEAGFQFARWVGDDADVDDDPAPETTVVRMTADRTVVAEFKRAPVKPAEEPDPESALRGPACGAGCGAGTALATPVILLGLADLKRRRSRCSRGT